MLLHLFRRRELVGDGCIEEEHVMYAVGWAKKGNSGAGHACAIPALLLGGQGGERAPAFAATADQKDKAAMPALARDRRLQGAPRPWILRE